MGVIAVTVRGLPPGVMMVSPANIGVKPPKGLTDEQVAERLAYRLEDGNLGFPALAFGRAILDATKGQSVSKLDKNGREAGGERSALGAISLGWEIHPKDLLPLMLDGEPIRDYFIDRRSVVNKTTKGRMVSWRPVVAAPWEAHFDIIWNDTVCAWNLPDHLETFLRRAGQVIGVGGFRPNVAGKATGGWFGLFEVVHWDVQRDADVPAIVPARKAGRKGGKASE